MIIEEEKKVVKKEEKKNYGPPVQRTKNSRGDYVVTKISIPDRVVEKKKVISTTFP